MPALQVRDFPDALYGALKESAARNHRSIAQQTTALIEEGLAREALRLDANAGLSREQEAKLAAIPSAVHEASARAHFVDPFSWAAAYEAESTAVLEERRRRREKAKQMISQVNTSAAQTAEGIAKLVRSMREERADTIGDHAFKAFEEAGA